MTIVGEMGPDYRSPINSGRDIFLLIGGVEQSVLTLSHGRIHQHLINSEMNGQSATVVSPETHTPKNKERDSHDIITFILGLIHLLLLLFPAPAVCGTGHNHNSALLIAKQIVWNCAYRHDVQQVVLWCERIQFGLSVVEFG